MEILPLVMKDVSIGTIEASGCVKLDDVLHVDGLKANLFSISQLWDEGRIIHFIKIGCVVKNRECEVVH